MYICFILYELLTSNYVTDKKDEIAAGSTKKFQSILNEVDGMHHLGIYILYSLMDLVFTV